MPRFAGRVSRYAWRRSPHGRASLQPAAVAQWMVGARSFNQGSADTSDIQPSGPAGYVTGGIYGVDPAATALPSGMTLSDAGVLFVGSAAAGTTNGVVFSYHEPGALPTLTLHPNATGTLPYVATVYPVEGAVPAGQVLVSPDDANLRSSVLSAWPDGSAQVVVLAGSRAVTSGVTQAIRVRPGAASGAALTTAAITAAISSIGVNFGTAASITNFGSPDRVWWANAQTICARYRLAIPGKGVMEAVIDVHAFAGGQAWVEVVVENGKVNSAAPSGLVAQTYAGATVSVNGTTIATVGSSWAGGSTHQPFRSWYCSAKIVSSTVTALTTAQQQRETFGIQVTHDTASLMAHPLFFKNEKASAFNFDSAVPEGAFFGASQTYGADTYVPWTFGRHLWQGMGQTGGSPGIGHYPQWEARYIHTANKNVANAVIASALSLLSFPVNYRDTATHSVSTFTQISGKSFGTGYPKQGDIPFANYNYYEWDYGHSPAVGLMAFLCRPSPIFIELSQSIAIFQGLAYTSNLFGFYFECRARAWCFRNLTHATFLTPDGHAWKAPAKTNMAANITRYRTWETDPEQRLNVHFNYEPGWYRDDGASSNQATFGMALWMHHFLTVEMYRSSGVKLLAGADKTDLDSFADWCLAQPVRFINESTAGEWRYCGAYNHNIGTQDGNEANEGRATTIGMPATWAEARALTKVESPPPVSGPLYNLGAEEFTTYSVGWSTSLTAGNYVSMFFAALACAVERGVTGAETAWTTFSGATNFSAFRDLAAQDARHNIWPRNK
jgi:hypothetical protein